MGNQRYQKCQMLKRHQREQEQRKDCGIHQDHWSALKGGSKYCGKKEAKALADGKKMVVVSNKFYKRVGAIRILQCVCV